MEEKRATVMLLHGSSEDRLRQAIAQGLVKNELRKDIEDTLAAAEDTRNYAEAMQRQVEKQKHVIQQMAQKAQNDAEYYRKAVAALKREEKRAKDHRDMLEAFLIAAIGVAAFIIANLIGKLFFSILA